MLKLLKYSTATLALLAGPSIHGFAQDAEPKASVPAPQTQSEKAKPFNIMRLFRRSLEGPSSAFKKRKQQNYEELSPDNEIVGSVKMANAQVAFEEYNLRGMVEGAVTTSDRLRIAQSEATIAEINVWKQMASFAPTVNLAWDVSRVGKGLHTAVNGTESSELTFSLNFPIFTSGKRVFSLQAARSSELAAIDRAKVAKNDIMEQTVIAFLQYMQAAKTVELLGQNVNSLKRLATAVRSRQKNGIASKADVYYVNANVSNAQRQKEMARSNQKQLAAQLESLTGLPVKITYKLPTLSKLINQGEERLVAQAIVNNPELSAAKHSANAQDQMAKATRSGYLPQVNMYGEYDVGMNSYSRSQQLTDWKVGVRLTMPLVDLTTVAAIAESRERAQFASYQVADTRRNLELETRTLFRAYASSKRQYDFANQRVSYLAKVAKAENEKYKEGVGSLDSVLEQKQALAQATIDATSAKMEAYVSAYRILISTGQFDHSYMGM